MGGVTRAEIENQIVRYELWITRSLLCLELLSRSGNGDTNGALREAITSRIRRLESRCAELAKVLRQTPWT